ncbi:MAG: hypothetical protein P8Y71_22830 [Pseudolabrys sp.]
MIFVLGAATIIGASELGRWFGTSVSHRGGDNVAPLESAVLTLLALMIGFTFAMALSRFEARREGLLREANAISTTALRARLLPETERAATLKLLREYVQLRLDISNRVLSDTEMRATIQRSNTLQEALWRQAKTIASKNHAMVPTGLFVQSVNNMIDLQSERLDAYFNRLPLVIVIGLFAIAGVAGGFSGYSGGVGGQRSRPPLYVVALLVAAVIVLILDLDRPQEGFIRVNQQPMRDVSVGLVTYGD